MELLILGIHFRLQRWRSYGALIVDSFIGCKDYAPTELLIVGLFIGYRDYAPMELGIAQKILKGII
jgi:hypothetical protein